MLSGERGDHILRGNAKPRHFCQVDIHAYPAFASTADQDLAHAIDILQQFFDLLSGYPVEFIEGTITLERQPHHRNRIGIDLRHDRCFRLTGKIVDHLVDFGLYLVEGYVGVLAELERNPHL
jgi:hypothetical protein